MERRFVKVTTTMLQIARPYVVATGMKASVGQVLDRTFVVSKS